MKHVASVAGRELRGLFVSPVAYVVLALFSVAAGIFFFASTAFFSEWVMRLTSYQAFDELARWNLNDQLIGQFYSSMSVILIHEGRKVVDAPLEELTAGGSSLDEIFARETTRDAGEEESAA